MEIFKNVMMWTGLIVWGTLALILIESAGDLYQYYKRRKIENETPWSD